MQRTRDSEWWIRQEAILRRELKQRDTRIATLTADNARLREKLASPRHLDPLHQATIADITTTAIHLHTLADPTPTPRFDTNASKAADPPLPHQPTEWPRYGLELYMWRLRGETQRVLSHHPIGDGTITPPGPRPTPPPRQEDG